MKVATKCLPTNINNNNNNINTQQTNNNNLNYVNHNNSININSTTRQYTSNSSTTQSWPVIHRNSTNQYDFEALLYLNHLWKDEFSSSSENTSINQSVNQSIYENINNQNIMQTQTQAQDSTTICSAPPPVIFLFITLFMTSSATAMLCAAIMTDHWEHVTWDKISLERMSNTTNNLEWMLDSKVARLAIKDHGNRGGVFLVPMHGGIWTLCIDLTEHEMRILGKSGFPRAAPCINYLAGNIEGPRENEEGRNDWQHSESQASLQPHLRMQNLSISCSLVCLIILGSAALVGAFGVCQRQISAILITGVMYLLAALFALFTLMIIHFKRQQSRPSLESDFDSTVDGVVAVRGAAKAASTLLGARIFTTSWSLDLGWGGVVLCTITSILWILLSKIMRYNPISAFMI